MLVTNSVKLSEKSLSLGDRILFEGTLYLSSLVLPSLFSHDSDVRVKTFRMMLEDLVKSSFHLLNKEAIEISLELISLGCSLTRCTYHSFLMLFNSQSQYRLLELVSQKLVFW